jgi:predicted TIM-barrel fold metal-dependent hydrolase
MIGPIDCHAHVFTRDLPMAADARVPEADAPIARYLALLDAHAIAGAVLVQPSFLGTDNGYLLAAIAQAPERLRGVAVVEPAITVEALNRLEAAGVAGIRLNVIGRAVPPLAEPPWRGLIERVAWRGWHVEVLAEGAQWTALLPPLAAAGARIVVDHFGRPQGGRACAGFRAILDAGGHADVWAKLSAPYGGAGPARSEAARDCARALRDALGPRRLLWGSDWPWLQHPEVADYAATRAWLDDWLPDAAERDAALVANPAGLYGFGRAPGSWTDLV